MDNQGPRQYGAGDPSARIPKIDDAYIAQVDARQRALDQRRAEFRATAALTRASETAIARNWYGDDSPQMQHFQDGMDPAVRAELAEMRKTVERALPPDPTSRWGGVAAQFQPERLAELTQTHDRQQASFRLYSEMNAAALQNFSERFGNLQERARSEREYPQPTRRPTDRGREY